jgi:hypothetical protein
MKSARRMLEPSPVALVEEAVHLVRGASAATLAVYYVGTVPFVLGLLFFWAHTTWFQPSPEQVAWGALGLVGLFTGMKVAQAEFCARLMASRLGAPPELWTWARRGRVAIAQLRLQSWTLVVQAGAAVIVAAFGWVYAYAQNLTVIGDDERLHHEALTQAKLWPRQNHIALLLIAVLALCAWFNVGAAFAAVPWLANKLLGIENLFGLTGWWFFNTTVVASVTALTWLGIDPLVKAFYVLRVFHGRARRNGEDVRVELHLARRSAGGARVAAALLMLCLLPLAPLSAAEVEMAPPPTTAVQPAQLDRAIDGVLGGPDFRWRLRPPPGQEAKRNEGVIRRFLRQGVDMVVEMGRSIGRWIRRVVDWFDRQFTSDKSGSEKDSRKGGGGSAINLLRVMLYVFIAAAVVLILWLIWLMVRGAQRNARPVLAAQAVTAAAPDLRDENVQAAQLPADGWLALAREQMQRGEWRLALRALYLATLARLATEGLVSLAKFKTNLDYEREVRRRALSRTEVATGFARRRREFEDVWYGRAPVAEPHLRAWMAELERPASP